MDRLSFSIPMIRLILLSLLLSGCASMEISDFAEGEPDFDPIEFFTGHTRSTGVMEDRGGNPTKRVLTETHGVLEEGSLQIEQDLWLGNADPIHRSWQIRRVDSHRYEATASDVVGTIHGEARGDVFHWKFRLKLIESNPLANVTMSQWMYLQPDGRTMVNHTTFKKAGIVISQVTEQFAKQD